jgi:hypothetical protein
MKDEWKILTNLSEAGLGIYQEKMIVCSPDAEMLIKLKAMVKENYPEAEECVVPAQILNRFPHSFGYWVNKHDPTATWKEIKSGSIRKKIT